MRAASLQCTEPCRRHATRALASHTLEEQGSGPADPALLTCCAGRRASGAAAPCGDLRPVVTYVERPLDPSFLVPPAHPSPPTPPLVVQADTPLEQPRPVVTYMARPGFSRRVLNEHDILRYILSCYNVTLRVTVFEVGI